MRDIATKVDSSSSLTASEFNSFVVEVENFVRAVNIVLDAAGGPDNDLFMVARAALITAIAGSSYQDNGAANTFVLAAVQANFEQPTSYVDGMTVRFKAAATNTGACTINVEGLGAISFTKAGGGAYTAGEIVAGNIITAQYFNGTNRFEEVANTTPEATGPAAPNQFAVYSDSGSAAQITLTIEPGFNQPAAFTDQMVILFKANATNDGVGPHPVNVIGLGAKDLVEKDGSDPIAGRITADDWVLAVFREVRDEFEIAFVYENPAPDVAIAATVSSSSGTVWNLAPVAGVRAPTAYIDGMVLIFKAPVKNDGALTVNFNGLGGKSVRRGQGSGNLVNREIETDAGVILQYDQASDFLRIVATGSKRGRITRASVVANEQIAAAGETQIQWDTPELDQQLLYDATNENFEITGGRGIKVIDVNAFVISTLPAGEAASFSLRRTRGGATVAFGAGAVRQGDGNNGLTMTTQNIVVEDGDVFNLFAATTSPTAVPISFGTISITVKQFDGEE